MAFIFLLLGTPKCFDVQKGDFYMKQENILLNNIRSIIDTSKKAVVYTVNTIMLQTYWEIGRLIVEEEQSGSDKAQYGDKTIKNLSIALTKEYGKGFGLTNIKMMRRFFLSYQKSQTVSDQLSWSHYLELLSIGRDNERSFYERECISSHWSVRELRHQIETKLYERMLIAASQKDKNSIMKVVNENAEFNSTKLFMKDPLVLDFIDVEENKPALESELEKSIISHLEKFLLELGKGFSFVGSQQRFMLGSTNYYVDMVFYNTILKCYVLIDLKMGKYMPEYAGKMNFYLNYYRRNVNDASDSDPIGIILCAEKDSLEVEYSLDGIDNQVFAGKYSYVIPTKQELETALMKLIEEYDESK